MNNCACTATHQPRRVVLTGGPGAGKTAVLELVRQTMCDHVEVLPESASIVFGGGFPRGSGLPLKQAAQRAIFYVQRELEAAASSNGEPAIAVCDRGTIDALAYWPGPGSFWDAVDTALDEQLARYAAVIHLRVPSLEQGYNHQNPLRIETAEQAQAIDLRIAEAWSQHPCRYEIAASQRFLDKARAAIDLLHTLLPACCKSDSLAGSAL